MGTLADAQGRFAFEVSVAGLGCNNFGIRIDEDASKAVVDAALNTGINHFDTADIYGGGKCEEFLGRTLGSRRRRAVITKKVGMGVPKSYRGGEPRVRALRGVTEALPAPRHRPHRPLPAPHSRHRGTPIGGDA